MTDQKSKGSLLPGFTKISHGVRSQQPPLFLASAQSEMFDPDPDNSPGRRRRAQQMEKSLIVVLLGVEESYMVRGTTTSTTTIAPNQNA